jgi:hypothetical protein
MCAKLDSQKMSVNKDRWLQTCPLVLICFWISIHIHNVNGILCTSHDKCSKVANATQFCSWSICTDPTGWTYRCGICAPCSLCLCSNSSIDGACPLNRCPDAPTAGVRHLAGSFWAVDRNRPQLAELGYACVRRMSFSGRTFIDTQAPVSIADPALPPPPSDRVTLGATAASCPSLDRSGVFTLLEDTDPPRLLLSILAARSG